MTETEWWRRYVETLLELPHTCDDPTALTALLATAGYYKARHGHDRPAWLDPERSARSAHRLRFEAPEEARRTAAAMSDAKHEATPWWSPDEHQFWNAVEEEFITVWAGNASAARRLVRSETGLRLLTGCQRTWERDLVEDPVAFARAVHKSVAGRA